MKISDLLQMGNIEIFLDAHHSSSNNELEWDFYEINLWSGEKIKQFDYVNWEYISDIIYYRPDDIVIICDDMPENFEFWSIQDLKNKGLDILHNEVQLSRLIENFNK